MSSFIGGFKQSCMHLKVGTIFMGGGGGGFCKTFPIIQKGKISTNR